MLVQCTLMCCSMALLEEAFIQETTKLSLLSFPEDLYMFRNT